MDDTAQQIDVTIKALIFAAAKVGKIHPRLVRGSTRRQSVARLRQHAQYLAVTRLGHSLSEIGRRFDRDHTTILHSVRTVTAALEQAPEHTKALLDEIWSEAEVIARYQAAVDRKLVTMSAAALQPKHDLEPDTPAAVALPPPPPAPLRVKAPPVEADWRRYRPFSAEWWQANDLVFCQAMERVYRRVAA